MAAWRENLVDRTDIIVSSVYETKHAVLGTHALTGYERASTTRTRKKDYAAP